MPTNHLTFVRAAASLKSLFVGDALAMPVHWYYNTLDIYRQFPQGITRLEAAPAQHPSSIMSLHSTVAGGRSSHNRHKAAPEIVGDVILKGRRHLWNQAGTHYHHGMRAGENTLNSHCARVALRELSRLGGRYSSDELLAAYIDFMTADPPAHPDTYAESYHRGFFANLTAGKSPQACGAVTHDTDSIGALVSISAIAFSELLQGKPLAAVAQTCAQYVLLTHPSKTMAKVTKDYVGLLNDLLFRESAVSAREIIDEWSARSIGRRISSLTRHATQDRDVVGRLFSSACYITDSWPSVFYLAFKYCEDQRAGLLANANLGGDNVHRGAVLGSILGLSTGETVDELFEQLLCSTEIAQEIRDLLAAVENRASMSQAPTATLPQ